MQNVELWFAHYVRNYERKLTCHAMYRGNYKTFSQVLTDYNFAYDQDNVEDIIEKQRRYYQKFDPENYRPLVDWIKWVDENQPKIWANQIAVGDEVQATDPCTMDDETNTLTVGTKYIIISANRNLITIIDDCGDEHDFYRDEHVLKMFRQPQ
jgi:hypothetical protein